MAARWGTFAIGLGLLLAPLALGYGSAAAIVRDVAAGTLVCVAALAALQWPRTRAVNALAALFLLRSARRALDHRTVAVELAAAALLVAVALLPRTRPRRASSLAPPPQRASA
jgi:hypothetical protein